MASLGETLIVKRPEYAAAWTFSMTFLRHHAPNIIGHLSAGNMLDQHHWTDSRCVHAGSAATSDFFIDAEERRLRPRAGVARGRGGQRRQTPDTGRCPRLLSARRRSSAAPAPPLKAPYTNPINQINDRLGTVPNLVSKYPDTKRSTQTNLKRSPSG